MRDILHKKESNHLRIRASRALWEAVFNEDTPSFLDYYYQYKATENKIDMDMGTVESGGIAESGGRIEMNQDSSTAAVSMIHWNPYKIYVGGTKTDGGADDTEEVMTDGLMEGRRIPYIVGVATLPEYRHQGRMARLLREGLRREAQEGTPFVWLIPANGAIYEPFSFRYVGKKYIAVWDGLSSGEEKLTDTGAEKNVGQYDEAIQYREEKTEADQHTTGQYLTGQVEADQSAVGQPGVDQGFVIEELSEADDERVSSFLNGRLRELCDVFAIRSRAYIADARAQFSSDGGGIAVIKHRDDIEGYFSWWPEDGILKIREMVLSRRLEKLESDAQKDKRVSPITVGTIRESPIEASLLEAIQLKDSSIGESPIIENSVEDSPIEENLRSFFYAVGEKRNSEELKALSRGRIEAVTTGWIGTPVTGMPVQNVMFRVADVKSYLELFRSVIPFHIRVRVADDIVEENNRIFDWTVEADGARAEPFLEEDNGLDREGDDLNKAGDNLDKARYNLDEAGDGLDGEHCDVEATPEELITWLFTEHAQLETLEPVRGHEAIKKYTRIHLPECV